MNKQPVYYMQTDARWKNENYSAPGEKRTIGSSGCGPTCAAMLIATLKDKTVTPLTTAKWSMANGYKALNQGTYYSYFRPQFAAHGIGCLQLNSGNIYGHPGHATHDRAMDLLKDGHYLIACMGKGTWTSSGHFVVVWWADNVIHILDPANSNVYRLNGNPETFRAQVKYYWIIDAREHNKEDDEMDQGKFNQFMAEYLAGRNSKPVGGWAADAWNKAVSLGVFDGTAPRGFITREQVAVVLDRLGMLDKPKHTS